MKLPIEKVIKICINDHCDAIYHNIPKNHTKCLDCGGKLFFINEKTYYKKFNKYFFQYDFTTGNYYRPEKNTQLSLF